MNSIKLYDFCVHMGFNEAAEDLIKPYWAQLLRETSDGVPEFMQRSFYEKYYPRGCFYCPEKFSSLEKVRNNRKLLIPLRCSEIISK